MRFGISLKMRCGRPHPRSRPASPVRAPAWGWGSRN